MLECLILGDSIAKGVSDIRKECVAYVKSGINSDNFIKTNTGNYGAKTVIISLGSNDLQNINTEEAIEDLRRRVNADHVYWILPNIKERVRKIVWMVARHHGDHVLDARNYDRSPDTVHPTYQGYKGLAKDTK